MKPIAAATSMLHTAEIDLTDGIFDIFSGAVRCRYETTRNVQLFVTDVSGDEMYDLYLRCLPVPLRQHHTCNCCKSFFRRYANLVTIDEKGNLNSALWDASLAPAMYAPAANQLRLLAEKGSVVAPFFSSERSFGTGKTGFWTHFAVPNTAVFQSATMSAYEQMALKKEHFGTVRRALDEFSPALLTNALALLDGDVLSRAEKVKGPVQFLFDLHAKLRGVRAVRKRKHIIWKAIAKAPAGFCTPRSGMAGSLLEELASGKSITTVKRNFDVKMRGENYMRPKAAPRAGNIAQGNKLVERMGLERSLERRRAGLHEVDLFWTPNPVSQRRQATSGIFSGLEPASTLRQPAQVQNMTWVKFARDVLPRAAKMHVVLPGGQALPLGSFTTGIHADAPRLFQWDSPFAWYLYVGGSTPGRWSLRTGKNEVVGVAMRPGSELPNQGVGVMLMLKGARDTGSPGLAVFPECLRSEMHAVRSTIEAYSKTRRLAPSGFEQDASGLILGSSKGFHPVRIEVDFGHGVGQTYFIDRWE